MQVQQVFQTSPNTRRNCKPEINVDMLRYWFICDCSHVDATPPCGTKVQPGQCEASAAQLEKRGLLRWDFGTQKTSSSSLKHLFSAWRSWPDEALQQPIEYKQEDIPVKLHRVSDVTNKRGRLPHRRRTRNSGLIKALSRQTGLAVSLKLKHNHRAFQSQRALSLLGWMVWSDYLITRVVWKIFCCNPNKHTNMPPIF